MVKLEIKLEIFPNGKGKGGHRKHGCLRLPFIYREPMEKKRICNQDSKHGGDDDEGIFIACLKDWLSYYDII
jgi:hypothetical protein